MPVTIEKYERGWKLKGTDALGQSHRKRYPDLRKDQVQAIADQINAQASRAKVSGALGVSQKKRHTFTEAAIDYVQDVQMRGKKVRAVYIENAIAYFDGKWVDEINEQDVHTYAISQFPHHCWNSRKTMGLHPVRSIIYHAVRRQWRPDIRISGFREKDPKKIRQPVTWDWLMKFVNAARDMAAGDVKYLGIAELELLRVTTSMRISEVVDLDWDDVDFDKCTATVVQKGQRPRAAEVPRFVIEDLKRLRAAIDWWLASDKLPGISRRRLEGGRVCLQNQKTTAGERRREVCDRAGISYAKTHDAGRRTFASLLHNEGGMSSHAIAPLGGWDSKDMPDLYITSDHKDRTAADFFDRMMEKYEPTTPEPAARAGLRVVK